MKILIAQQAQDPTGNLISTIVMFGAIFAIFYFMVMRPQQKRAKEREKMLSNVQKGDKVVTSGGLHGTIAGMEDNIIILQVSDNVKLKFEKAAITTVISK
ncbi:MAG: UPF0092 membrane protein [Ignavibacteriales bacterium]|jgi:preprotein translocase subunit YajC